MHVLTLSELIVQTFDRTLKFREDGTLAHKVDRAVIKVIAIAIASDILDTYRVTSND